MSELCVAQKEREASEAPEIMGLMGRLGWEKGVEVAGYSPSLQVFGGGCLGAARGRFGASVNERCSVYRVSSRPRKGLCVSPKLAMYPGGGGRKGKRIPYVNGCPNVNAPAREMWSCNASPQLPGVHWSVRWRRRRAGGGLSHNELPRGGGGAPPGRPRADRRLSSAKSRGSDLRA